MTDVPSAELLERYRSGTPESAEELHRRYAARLLRLARSRLSPTLAARVDAEDVVQSAWRSFFSMASNDIVLREAGDLWRLLARITVRKACRSARRQRAECRSIEREQPWSEDEVAALSREPTPADVAALDDEMRCLLTPLDSVQRRIVELRLLGHEAEDIAAQVSRSSRTVRRVLAWVGDELQRRLSPPEEPTGEDLIDYADVVLERQLGAGATGKVYRARWRGEAVAVKLLARPLRSHARLAARLLEEGAVLRKLRHPGIVRVHGLGLLPDGGHFLILDLMTGDLGRQLPVAASDGLRWTAEVADAVDYAHHQGVIHCDLKPSNLLLDAAGRIRVSDFGLACRPADRPLGGTLGFAAPEQLDPDLGPISERTDVYGIGAVLFALLTARSPDISPMGVPAKVELLCRQLLAPKASDRPASAAIVACQLREL